MQSRKTSLTSQTASRTQDAQKELNRLHRRRIALINLIRSVEEYLMVTDANDSLLTDGVMEASTSAPTPKKPTLSVVYTRSLKELMA